MNENNYSKEIARLIQKTLDKDDWRYAFNEQKGLFDFSMSFNSGYIKKAMFEIKVEDDYYVVYTYSPFGVDVENKKMMAEMAEFICRSNYCMKTGGFELDFEDGEVRLKNLVNCCNMDLNEKIILDSIYSNITTFKFNSIGIFNVLTEKTTAKQAYKSCLEAILKKILDSKENSDDNEDESCTIKTDLFNDSEGDE